MTRAIARIVWNGGASFLFLWDIASYVLWDVQPWKLLTVIALSMVAIQCLHLTIKYIVVWDLLRDGTAPSFAIAERIATNIENGSAPMISLRLYKTLARKP